MYAYARTCLSQFVRFDISNRWQLWVHFVPFSTFTISFSLTLSLKAKRPDTEIRLSSVLIQKPVHRIYMYWNKHTFKIEHRLTDSSKNTCCRIRFLARPFVIYIVIIY